MEFIAKLTIGILSKLKMNSRFKNKMTKLASIPEYMGKIPVNNLWFVCENDMHI